MSNFITLDVPHGMFWVINPFQESDRVHAAKLTESKLKCPVNFEEVHPGLHYFYGILKSRELGPLIGVELVWFGGENQYYAIVVGPFGCVPNSDKVMMQFQQLVSRMQVPEGSVVTACCY